MLNRNYQTITQSTLPSHAQVVIAGAGMIGNSVAYHLVQRGWSDIVIIDKGGVADGTSKYGSGMLGLFRPQHERKIVQYCIDLYQSLQEQGYDLGLEHCGSVNLAASKDRLISLQRRASGYRPTGVECHLVGPKEIRDLHPHINTDDIHGGVWIPKDACVNAGKVSEVLAYVANQGGAKFVSGCGVKKVLTKRSSTPSADPTPHMHHLSKNVKVTGVETDIGHISCEYFVNTAGIWAKEIGRMMDTPVRIPICPAEHFFMTFKPIPELENTKLPNVRDYDSQLYVRQFSSSYMMGAFETLARPWDVTKHGIDPDWNQIKEEHWIHFEPYIRAAMHRLPILKETQYDFLLNTPDAFTPDGRWILGETPEVGNYFVCAGMNGNSLQGAGGVGKAVADWIVKGYPPGNMLEFEVQRFTSLHNNSRFLSERAKEVVGKHYKLEYPLVSEFTHGRNIRSSTIHSELEAHGGVFGQRMGWEVALYFDTYHREDARPELPQGSFGKPEFLDNIHDEYDACKNGVGVIDMSSFAKLSIEGKDEDSVVNYLQNLCSNDVNITQGEVISTGMQNKGGGYENDCLLVRTDKDTFFMVSPSQQQTRVYDWMENHLPEDDRVGLYDVTSMYTVLILVGPKSKDLLAELSGEDVNIPPFTCKNVNVGFATGVMAMAVTHTREPGYSLYIPSEFALKIYDNLMYVGRDYGIRNVGQLAMKFLRVEKFIPTWTEELSSVISPIQVNRTFKVDFKKSDFIGKDALEEQNKDGVYKRLVQFHLEDFDKEEGIWPWGGESVYRDGKFVGTVTSSAYGFHLQKMVALGFVENRDTSGKQIPVGADWINDKDVHWEMDIAGDKIPISVHLHPPKKAVNDVQLKAKTNKYLASQVPVMKTTNTDDKDEDNPDAHDEDIHSTTA